MEKNCKNFLLLYSFICQGIYGKWMAFNSPKNAGPVHSAQGQKESLRMCRSCGLSTA